jgi:hypothetical protein
MDTRQKRTPALGGGSNVNIAGRSVIAGGDGDGKLAPSTGRGKGLTSRVLESNGYKGSARRSRRRLPPKNPPQVVQREPPQEIPEPPEKRPLLAIYGANQLAKAPIIPAAAGCELLVLYFDQRPGVVAGFTAHPIGAWRIVANELVPIAFGVVVEYSSMCHIAVRAPSGGVTGLDRGSFVDADEWLEHRKSILNPLEGEENSRAEFHHSDPPLERSDSEHPEASYRRGFQQGSFAVVDALEKAELISGSLLEKLKRFGEKVYEWRFTSRRKLKRHIVKDHAPLLDLT